MASSIPAGASGVGLGLIGVGESEASGPSAQSGQRRQSVHREPRLTHAQREQRELSKRFYERFLRPPRQPMVAHPEWNISATTAQRWNLACWLTQYPDAVPAPAMVQWCESLPTGAGPGEYLVDADAVHRLLEMKGRGSSREGGVDQLTMKMEWLLDAKSPAFRFGLAAADKLFGRLARSGQTQPQGLLDRALFALGADQATRLWYMREDLPARVRLEPHAPGTSPTTVFADGVVEATGQRYVVWRELIAAPQAEGGNDAEPDVAQYYLVQGDREPTAEDFALDALWLSTQKRTLFYCRAPAGAFALEYWLTPGFVGKMLLKHQLRGYATAWFKGPGALSQPMEPGRLCTIATPYGGANKKQVFEEVTYRQPTFDSDSESASDYELSD